MTSVRTHRIIHIGVTVHKGSITLQVFITMPKRNGSALSRAGKKVKVGRSRPSRAALMPRNIHQHVKFFKTFIAGNAANTPYLGSVAFLPGGLSGFAELASLYDQYRLDKLEVAFYLRVDPSAQSATTAIYPRLWWSDDADSAEIITQSAMQERSNVQVHVLTPQRPVVKTIVPSVLRQVYLTGTTNATSPMKATWLDITYTQVPHFGANFNIEDLTNPNYQVDVIYKAWVSCKNSR